MVQMKVGQKLTARWAKGGLTPGRTYTVLHTVTGADESWRLLNLASADGAALTVYYDPRMFVTGSAIPR
jgi:hypothetical protein